MPSSSWSRAAVRWLWFFFASFIGSDQLAPTTVLVNALANADESAALIALHDYCGWNLGWSAAEDACEGGPRGFGWDGIECDASDHHIEKVELQDRRELACNMTGVDDLLPAFNPAILTRLISFTIMGAGLYGNLPMSFCSFPSLTLLNLDNNGLEANFSNYSFASPTLATLRMNRNQLYGQIPASLVNNQHLVELDLSYNDLDGDIVSKLNANAALVFVDLSGNRFSGALPVFGTETHLAALKVSHNNFTGSIPSSIGSFGVEGNGLVVLHINGNQLTGTLPQAISGLSTLEEFDVADNRLTGLLPALHTMAAIEQVELGGSNLFACPVPSADAIYDSATCECEPGFVGAQGTYDGALWNATACRAGNGSITSACSSLSRFNCRECHAGQFSAVAWSPVCSECDAGFVRSFVCIVRSLVPSFHPRGARVCVRTTV